MKVSLGNDTYTLTKYDKTHITDVAIINYPNTGGYFLQNWITNSNDKNNNGKNHNFIKSTKTNSPTVYSGATSLPLIGKSFMYTETSSNNQGNNVVVRFERTDIIYIIVIPFYYNTFSILTNDSLKAMGRFRIQLLLEDNTWSTRYNLPKNDRFSDTSTDWTQLGLNFTAENYGNKLIFDEIDSVHIDMCLSKTTITHSVY